MNSFLRIKSLSFLCSLLLAIPAFSQPYWKYQRLPFGMDGSDLNGMAVPAEEEVWVAANDGLLFYDHGNLTIFTTLNSNLPDDWINDVILHNGSIWVGTKSGLAEFNGTGFNVYTTQNGLIGNEVECLASGPNGSLWIGTAAGISSYDGSTFTNLNQYPAYEMAIHPNGDVWIISKKYGLFPVGTEIHRLSGNTWTDFANSTVSPDAMLRPTYYIHPNGDVYITSASGSYYWYDGSSWHTSPHHNQLMEGGVNAMIAQPDGTIWTGMNGGANIGGVRKISNNQIEVHSLILDESSVWELEIFQNQLYLLTSNGVAHADLNIRPFRYSETLDINNIHAGINANGELFKGPMDDYTPRFEMNPGDSTHGIFIGKFWIATNDQADIRVAAGRFDNDFVPGSVTKDFVYYRDPILKISRQEIVDHQQNYNQTGYVMPAAIAYWPCNGDSALGEGVDMAPFYDVNSNGCYDPENGDYPYIKGDQAIYFIFNDSLSGHLSTGGAPIGMEVHCMAYAYDQSAIPELDNTIFLQYTLINRSPRDYDSVKTAMFIDWDLGMPLDDYIGCSQQENMFYVYNGDNFDEDTWQPGFEQDPPALGVKMLSHPLDHHQFLQSSASATGYPNTDMEYFHVMDARWREGTPISYGGVGYHPLNTNYYRFMFDGDPVANTGWTEALSGNTADDRRGMGSFPFFSLHSGERQSVELAICFAEVPGSDHLGNVTNLLAASQVIQQFYDTVSVGNPVLSTNRNCAEPVSTGNHSKTSADFSFFPNPNRGEFTVRSSTPLQTLNLYSLTGQLLEQIQVSGQKEFTLQVPASLRSGIYILRWENEAGQTGTQKFSLQR